MKYVTFNFPTSLNQCNLNCMFMVKLLSAEIYFEKFALVRRVDELSLVLKARLF